ncbi:MAG: hypothetical protein ACLR8P_07885 [Clostridium fessum]
MAYQYADIIIDISHEKVDRPFQYRIPTQLAEEITAGTCVTVPFGKGNSLRTGYVVGMGNTVEYDPSRIKGDSWDRTGQYVGAIPAYPSGVVDAGTLWRDDEPDAQNRTSRQGKDKTAREKDAALSFKSGRAGSGNHSGTEAAL